MLSVQEMTCRECGQYDDTTLEMVLSKNGLVYFQVTCNKCGSYSHHLEYTEINRAVKEWINNNVATYKRYKSVGKKDKRK